MEIYTKRFDEVAGISSLSNTDTAAVEVVNGAASTDAELVAAVLQGDETSYAEIFERHKRRIARLISRYFRHSSEIEEFTQQTFTNAYFSLSRFRGNEQHSFSAWLSRIAINVCYDEFRRRQRKQESLLADLDSDEERYLELLKNDLAIDAGDRVVALQLIEKIMQGVDVDDRMAMTLVYSQEYSVAEAAKLLGISISGLKSRMFRCRAKLRARFGHIFK